MSRLAAILIALLALQSAPAAGQGFAGLGTEVDGFAAPRPNPRFRFPEDHGAHPAYRIEWWYLTAVLEDADGTQYGAQWTLFRSALEPHDAQGWETPQLWMGHAAITTPSAHHYAERLARGGLGVAGVEATPFQAFIDEWSMRSAPDRLEANADALAALDLSARGEDFAYAFALDANGPLVFQGDSGFSVKSADGQASYYYSQPFYQVTGTLDLPEGEVEVTGQAWLDREYSSQPLSETQLGWDWVSFHLDSGDKVMGFQLRQSDGSVYTAASWITPDGTPTAFEDGALSMTALETAEVAGRQIPVRWRVELPARHLDVEIAAVNSHSWMQTLFSYWEGPVSVTGSHAGGGYLEMTGYGD
ncbi:MAG: iron ABC transporter permease [Maricaulis sp.]|jgi:predicted secreted hydrolase|uniref:lipocalin-like domain-containing protein n=1 Tax=Maricaulis sp. TaxID=1486257 RepID=UPI001B26BDEE|nr:lipocalin-like domain-containing protein [Maricaulis sp.]MBO6878565.1 iron ABC transporter permease [Maricaulis sp.]